MPEGAYGLIELVLVFGIVVAFLTWEVVKTRRAVRRDRENAAQSRREETL